MTAWMNEVQSGTISNCWRKFSLLGSVYGPKPASTNHAIGDL